MCVDGYRLVLSREYRAVGLIEDIKRISTELRNMVKAEEVKLATGRQTIAQKPKEGEGTVRRGREKMNTSPMQVNREEGEVQVPKGVPKEEPSLLKDIEQRGSKHGRWP